MRAYIICIDYVSTKNQHNLRTPSKLLHGHTREGAQLSCAPYRVFFGTLKIGEPDEIIDGYTEIFCEGHEIAHGRFALTVFP